jgi:hypothetical protein
MDSAAGYYALGFVSGLAVMPIVYLFAEGAQAWRWHRQRQRDRHMSEAWRRDMQSRAGKQWP